MRAAAAGTVPAESARALPQAAVGLAAMMAIGGFAVASGSPSAGLAYLALAMALGHGIGSLASP